MSARTIIESQRFYDPRSLWLHGSRSDFTQFRRGGKMGWDSGGIFLVKDTKAQEAYARGYGEKIYRCRVSLQPDQVFELSIPEHVERVLAVETEEAVGRDFMRSAEEGQRYGHLDWASMDQEVLELAGFKGVILAERPKGFNNFEEDILSLCVFDPGVIEIVGQGAARDVIEAEAGGVVAGRIFYHGARAGNTPFKSNQIRIPKDDAAYFSTDREYASGYAEELWPPKKEDEDKGYHRGQVHAVHLTIHNPKVFNPDNAAEFEAFTYHGFKRSELEAQGYDSVMAVFPAKDDTPEEIQVGVFSPSQVTPISIEDIPATEWKVAAGEPAENEWVRRARELIGDNPPTAGAKTAPSEPDYSDWLLPPEKATVTSKKPRKGSGAKKVIESALLEASLSGWIDHEGTWYPMRATAHELAAREHLAQMGVPVDTSSSPNADNRKASAELWRRGWKRVAPYTDESLVAHGPQPLSQKQLGRLIDAALFNGMSRIYDDTNKNFREVWAKEEA